MNDEQKETNTGDSGKPKRKRARLPAWLRPIAAAVAGALLAVLCKQLPSAYRAPCDLAAHVLPNACNADLNGDD